MPPFPYYRIPVLLFFWFADCTVLPFFFFSAFQYHHQTTHRTAETQYSISAFRYLSRKTQSSKGNWPNSQGNQAFAVGLRRSTKREPVAGAWSREDPCQHGERPNSCSVNNLTLRSRSLRRRHASTPDRYGPHKRCGTFGPICNGTSQRGNSAAGQRLSVPAVTPVSDYFKLDPTHEEYYSPGPSGDASLRRDFSRCRGSESRRFLARGKLTNSR